MTALAAKRRAPGLLAYLGDEIAGWITISPRVEIARIVRSKATPAVDDLPVWVIPCITVRRRYRGCGVAQALIRAAVDHAAKNGAPAVEAYPRAGVAPAHDELDFMGTEALFRKVGFHKVRGVPNDLPRGWPRRVTMRLTCASTTARRPRAPAAVGTLLET